VTAATQVTPDLWTGLLVSGTLDNNAHDYNKDGFLDMPKIQMINVFNRWLYLAPNGLQSRTGIKFLYEDREGGHDTKHNLTNYSGAHYFTNIENKNFTVDNKTGFPIGTKDGQSIGIITSFTYQEQNSSFGEKTYNGTQTSTVLTLVTYVFSGGLTVNDSIFGSKEILVDGSYYCSIACGLKAYEKKLCGCDDATKAVYDKNFKLAMSYVALIRLLIECNGGSNISQYLDKINDIIGDCDCGCDDDDDEFSRVTGWGSLVGADGTNGENGISAYQVALANGFVGTQAQWLASLVGAAGANGTPLIYNNTTVDSLHSGAYATLKSYLIPANTLTQTGDSLEVTAIILADGAVATKNTKIVLGGQDAMPSLSMLGYLKMPTPILYQKITMVITRIGATQVLVHYAVPNSFGTPYYYSNFGYTFYESSISVNDLTASTNLLDIQGFTTSPDTIVCKQLTVEYLKKS